MKFKTVTYDLGELYGVLTNEGEPVKVDVPRGVTEGMISEVRRLGREVDADGKRVENIDDQNLLALDQIVNWNMDDENGKPLPLPRTLKDKAKKLELMHKVPIDLLVLLAENLGGNQRREEVAGFSKTSSEQS